MQKIIVKLKKIFLIIISILTFLSCIKKAALIITVITNYWE